MNRGIKIKQSRFSRVERLALIGLLLSFCALLFSGCDEEKNDSKIDPPVPQEVDKEASSRKATGKSSSAGDATSGISLNDELYLGPAIVVKNVTAWPVYSRTEHPLVEKFITLEQAQKEKKAVIREVGVSGNATNDNSNVNARSRGQLQQAQQAQQQPQQAPQQPQQAQQELQQDQQPQQLTQQQGVSGTVNTLMIDNKGDTAILILAGTLVKGGKQDRQIAQDFIVPPGKSVPVDAFCVEHGRWNANREGKSTSGLFQAQKALASKSVRDSAQYENSQQAVWNNVAASNSTFGKSPQSGTYFASVEETDKKALKRRKQFTDKLTESLKKLENGTKGPVGLAYAVDGKVIMIRVFSHPEILKIHQETLINTIAMEGEMAQRKALANKKKIFEGAAKGQLVADLIKAAEKAKEKIVKTRAGNRNFFKMNKRVWNSSVHTNDKNGKSYSPSQSWTTGK